MSSNKEPSTDFSLPVASEKTSDLIGRDYRAPRFDTGQSEAIDVFTPGSNGSARDYLGTSISTYFAEKYSHPAPNDRSEFFSSVSVGTTGQLGLLFPFIGLGPYVGSSLSFGLNAQHDFVIQFQTVSGID
jgi:hypothetical protein